MYSSPAKVRLKIEVHADLTLVRFEDNKILDELAIVSMGQQLLDQIDKQGVRKMILNFEKVHALSSAAIGKLIHLHKHLVEELHGQLVMCSLKDYLIDAFKLLQLDRRFTIVANEEAALQLF